MGITINTSNMIYYNVEARPRSDDGYFEQMSKAVFRSGFNWKVIENKWPDIRKAFADFSIPKVAKYRANDVDRLMKDKGVVRNYRKITATIENAGKMQKIKKQYGSFRQYLTETILKAPAANGFIRMIDPASVRMLHLNQVKMRR